MENDNLTLQEITDKIIDFNLDESINDLKKYYATPTIWEIIKQSRRETSHTQFLAWFFNNRDFNADPNTGPIKKLIVLLLKWARIQEKAAEFDEELKNSIYQQDFSIISYNVVPEYPISVESNNPNDSNDPAYGEGIIDILITIEAIVNNTQRTIHIVVENKIDAPETKKCFDENGELIKKPNKNNIKTTIFQTKAYYQYITDCYKGDINLFVYLKPTDCSLDDIIEAECAEKKYIQINYQELLDYIIQPVSEQTDISEENAYRLKDYIKALGKPSETDDNETSNNKITIMAMEKTERELLKKFFEKNEDLIRAAINALGDEELSASMANIPPKGRPRRTYSINNGTSHYTMYEVLEKFIEMRLNSGLLVADINKEINGYIGGQRINISDNPHVEVYREALHYGKLTVNGGAIKYTKEWGDNNGNFTKLKTGINANYKDFQISDLP